MRIHFRVCADFYDKYGKEIYRVRPADLEGYHDVPEEIRQDPLFQMLKNDRSIEVTDDIVRRKQLENDPETIPENIPEEPVPTPETKKTTKKTSDRKDESA